MNTLLKEIAAKTARLRHASDISSEEINKKPRRVKTAPGNMLYVLEALQRINQARTQGHTALTDIARIRLHQGREASPQKHKSTWPLQADLLSHAQARPIIVRKLETPSLDYQIVVGEYAVITHLASRLDKILVEVIELSEEDVDFLSRGSFLTLEAYFRYSIGRRQGFEASMFGRFSI